MEENNKSFGKKVEKFAKMIIIGIIKQIFTVVIWLILIIGFFSYIFSNMGSNLKKSMDMKDGISKTVYTQDMEKVLTLSFPNGISDSHNTIVDFLGTVGNDRIVSLYEVMEAIDYAKEDNSIKSIYIHLDTCNASFEHIEEIGKKLKEFKNSGKKIYAYGNYLVFRNYMLASTADEIYMEPSASTFVNLTGYSAVFPYFKELTDNIGIRYNVIHVGDYKSYGENFVKKDMSNEFKSEIEKIYNEIYEKAIEFIAGNKGLDKEKLENIIYSGDLAFANSKYALKSGLIEGLKTKDEFNKEILKTENLVSVANYINLEYVKNKKKNINLDNKIAVIYAEGSIYMDRNDEDYSSSKVIMPKLFEENMQKAIDDKSIKGIVVRVNSPGGSALASEIIHNKIKNTKKPVYISMGNVAASGGYYISSAASKIYANNFTITGSIGVVSIFPNIEDMSKKIGINFETIKKGNYSDISNITKNTTQEEIEIIRRSMNEIYEEFKLRVSEGRNMDINVLEEYSQGKVWTGNMAKNIGLVDEIGGLNDAVSGLAKDHNILNYQIVNIEKKPNFKDYINFIKRGINSADILYGNVSLYEKFETYIDFKTFNRKPAFYFPYDYVIEN